MSPIVFKWGAITIYGYGLMWSVAIIGAFFWAEREAKLKGFPVLPVIDLVLVIVVSAVIGARSLHVAQNWGIYSKDWSEIFNADRGGMVYFGGFLAAGASTICWCRSRNLPLVRIIDSIVVYLPLGHGVGRIGCLLQGCCYGTRCDHPWAVQFPRVYSLNYGLIGSPAYVHHLEEKWINSSKSLSLPVHPTQIYEMAAEITLFGILLWTSRQTKFSGQVLAVYLILYSMARFSLEFFRGDNPSFLGPFTISQVISIILLLIGFWIIQTCGEVLKVLEVKIGKPQIVSDLPKHDFAGKKKKRSRK